MSADNPKAVLEEILVERIRPNEDNPRLAFRQGELDELQESIRRYGVQVPVAVYRDRNHYVLIDGERRWRCASKLNHKTIPALVREKPTKLNNLLLMFNIHALREQWDLLTISMKLPAVIDLMRKENGREPKEVEISNETGLSRGSIRRCKILMDLPSRYKDMLLAELKKPKHAQRLSEDLFIEIERALKTVANAMPGAVANREVAREALLRRYRKGSIKNIVALRLIPKIARAGRVGADVERAERCLSRLFSDDSYSLDEAYRDTVEDFYAERDIASRIESLLYRLESAGAGAVDDELREKLVRLIERAQQLLGG